MSAGPADGVERLKRTGISLLAGVMLGAGLMSGSPAMAETAVVVERTTGGGYDGFEDYAAKGNKMDESDVSCFANECRMQTASCFTDGSCLKGVTCLGRCKGEQACSTQCFAQYGGPKLDDWLSCTLEDHSCVKVPKDMDFSAIDKDPVATLANFNPSQLEGTWYKVLGVNKDYDCFDCQRNSFALEQGGQTADVNVQFRLAKPDSNDFWENNIHEKLSVDPPGSPRNFHTEGKLFGLTFKENWYVTGLSEEPGAEFVFVQYKGHTLQGSYNGGFVYAKQPVLPAAARPRVDRVAQAHGIQPSTLLAIDNSCKLRAPLPKESDAASMPAWQWLQYEAGFLFDLMEWVKPGTIHQYE